MSKNNLEKDKPKKPSDQPITSSAGYKEWGDIGNEERGDI